MTIGLTYEYFGSGRRRRFLFPTGSDVRFPEFEDTLWQPEYASLQFDAGGEKMYYNIYRNASRDFFVKRLTKRWNERLPQPFRAEQRKPSLVTILRNDEELFQISAPGFGSKAAEEFRTAIRKSNKDFVPTILPILDETLQSFCKSLVDIRDQARAALQLAVPLLYADLNPVLEEELQRLQQERNALRNERARLEEILSINSSKLNSNAAKQLSVRQRLGRLPPASVGPPVEDDNAAAAGAGKHARDDAQVNEDPAAQQALRVAINVAQSKLRKVLRDLDVEIPAGRGETLQDLVRFSKKYLQALKGD